MICKILLGQIIGWIFINFFQGKTGVAACSLCWVIAENGAGLFVGGSLGVKRLFFLLKENPLAIPEGKVAQILEVVVGGDVGGCDRNLPFIHIHP